MRSGATPSPLRTSHTLGELSESPINACHHPPCTGAHSGIQEFIMQVGKTVDRDDIVGEKQWRGETELVLALPDGPKCVPNTPPNALPMTEVGFPEMHVKNTSFPDRTSGSGCVCVRRL